MRGLTLKVDLAIAGPGVQELVAGLESRVDLHAQIAEREYNLIRDHFLGLEQSRHATAFRLGATPSGFWGMAANAMSFTAEEDAAVVSVDHPGVGRADHDVTIKPGPGKQWLTIPLIAAAYNQRAYRVKGLFFLQTTAMPLLAMEEEDGEVTPWYALVRSVTQPQDRSLLPSDEAINREALAGVRDYIDQLLAVKEAA